MKTHGGEGKGVYKEGVKSSGKLSQHGGEQRKGSKDGKLPKAQPSPGRNL